MIRIAAIFLAILALARAGCDNACSGHGTCSIRGICTCYDNWGLGLSHDSGDCSQRICPYEFAWVDTPDKKGSHHKYAECSNKGICNRDTGECECFPGYEGKACARTSCPNDCSGHGQCAFIENMPFQATPFDYAEGDYLVQDPKTFTYYYWDKSKTRGCICDPEYGDVDCSKHMCPYATDPMDIRLDMTSAAKYQVQKITFVPDINTPENSTVLDGQTFALTFKSKLNETFTTYPLVFDSSEDGFHDFVTDVQTALLKLPSRIIDRVEVHGDRYPEVYINITFVGDNVQGPQNLVTVKSFTCSDGCSPKITGLELFPGSMNVTELQLSDFNSYECGRRGKCDYTTGICQCFAGYTGLACNTITALV